MSDGPRRIQVVAGLIEASDRPGSYLVQRRPTTGARALLWEFPGGKVEAGESEEAALVREGREELGVELAVGGLHWRHVHAYPDLTVELAVYRARVKAGTPLGQHGAEVRFATPQEMLELPFCEADQPLVRSLGGRG